jgi:hypothetical protein
MGLFLSRGGFDWEALTQTSITMSAEQTDDTYTPKENDVFESVKDQNIYFMVAWSAPYTSEGEGVLYKGEKIRIEHDNFEKKPTGTFAKPFEYKKLQKRMISKKDRTNSKYSGFSFHIKITDLQKNFRLVGKAEFSLESHQWVFFPLP